MLFIDSDNAMGSRSGDVDDAFALAALIRGGAGIAAIASIHGNTAERRAFENNGRLAAVLGWHGPLLRAAEAAVALRDFKGRIAALGPLTSVVFARSASEIVLVGSNASTRGRWPPLWPHEFNLTKDVEATLAVFRSTVPLTIFPLDVARQLFVTRRELDAISGELGAFLRQGSHRWFRRLRLLKLTGRFPLYDLAAALYLLDCDGLTMERTTATMLPNTLLRFGRGEREVTVCRALNRARLWERFLMLVNG